MSVRLRLSAPVPAVIGKTMEEVGWGPYQFPALYAIDDGSILLSCASGQDSWTDYGVEALWRRSTDGGRSWSQPQMFDSCGVWPTLLTLGCGVTVCGYGRPGFFLRATEDPSAMKWEKPVTLIPGIDRSGEANEPHSPDDAWTFGTCSYCGLLPLSDTRFLVAYSDFFYPIPGELKRKVILARSVDVEPE